MPFQYFINVIPIRLLSKEGDMNQKTREVIFLEIEKALNDSPLYGTISIIVHFSQGQLVRIERGRSESYKLDSIDSLPKVTPEPIKTKEEPGLQTLKLFSLKEAKSILGLSMPTLYRHIKNGTIKRTRIGSRNFISTIELERLIIGKI